MRKLLLICAASLGTLAVAFGQTFNVTSPTEGAFLGQSNQVKFTIRGAEQEVRVRVRATGPAGTTEIEQRFSPNVDGEIDNQSITLNFSESSPEGDYVIEVSATEPGKTYPVITRNVIVDVVKPKFLTYSPLPNAFVSGIVPIRVQLDEPNVQEWRVQINNQDIPNNTGVSQQFIVNWNTAGILNDGNQTITIKVKDKAENEASQTISVTLDRVPPVISIQYPRSNSDIIPNTDFPVVVDITDGSQGSVDVTGIDVVIQNMNGQFLARVTRTSFRTIGSTVRWSGTVRMRRISLPATFKLVVTAVDRAGNSGAPQEVVLSTGRGRGR
jgi:hypothetical protein